MSINVPELILKGAELLRGMKGVRKYSVIGSALYLPEQANDVDFAVMLRHQMDPIDFVATLEREGWGRCGNYDQHDSKWAAIRKDELNFMSPIDGLMVDQSQFFRSHYNAFHMGKPGRMAGNIYVSKPIAGSMRRFYENP